MGQLVSSVLGTVGGLISGSKAADAAKGQADALRAAGDAAARMAQFRPIGLTTGFGTSRFNVNNGRVTSAGYDLIPELQALRNQLVSGAAGYDPTQLQNLIAPLSTGVSSLFNLGQGYLSESPQEAAQRFVTQQQNLLAPSRAAQFDRLQARNYATGRGGLGVQTGTGTAPANPALQAYYNALAQQDLELAAKGQQAGMEQARFGAGLLTSGTELSRQIPALYSASFLPIETQLGLARTVESMGQQPFQLSLDLANAQSGAGARAGQLYLQPQAAAAQAYSQYQGYSPLGSFLSGAGSMGGGGGLSSLFSGGTNPFNRYGSGLFDWGSVPTQVNRSWTSGE
jgi:hypothetical protein